MTDDKNVTEKEEEEVSLECTWCIIYVNERPGYSRQNATETSSQESSTAAVALLVCSLFLYLPPPSSVVSLVPSTHKVTEDKISTHLHTDATTPLMPRRMHL